MSRYEMRTVGNRDRVATLEKNCETNDRRRAMNKNDVVSVNYCYGIAVIHRRLTELTWGAMDLDLHLPAAMTAAAAAECRLGIVDDDFDFEVERTRQLTVLVGYVIAQVERPANPLTFEVELDSDSARPWSVTLKGVVARDLAGAAFYVFMLPDEE